LALVGVSIVSLFELPPEILELKKKVREFAEKEIRPLVPEIEKKNKIPDELIEKIYNPPNAFQATSFPKEYGGKGMGVLGFTAIAEEIAYFNGACGILVEIGELSGSSILFGTENQKKEFLPKLTQEGKIFAFAMTEPHCGSDAAAITTTAEADGDEYVINGRKWYISFADEAQYFVITAKTSPEKGARGISLFVAEKGPGVRLGKELIPMGLRGHRPFEVIFENCRVPKENLIGEEGRGLGYAVRTLHRCRISLAAGYLGLARAALDKAIEYAKERKAFGRSLYEFQAISFPIAEALADLEAARLLVYKAAWMYDKGENVAKESAMAKELASRVLLKAVDIAVTTLGGYGTIEDFDVERYYRDAKTWVFAQGTPEILKLTVSRSIFEPRRR